MTNPAEHTPHKLKLWLGVLGYGAMFIYYASGMLRVIAMWLLHNFLAVLLFVVCSVLLYYYFRDVIKNRRAKLDNRFDKLSSLLRVETDIRQRELKILGSKLEPLGNVPTVLSRLNAHIEDFGRQLKELGQTNVNMKLDSQDVEIFELRERIDAIEGLLNGGGLNKKVEDQIVLAHEMVGIDKMKKQLAQLSKDGAFRLPEIFNRLDTRWDAMAREVNRITTGRGEEPPFPQVELNKDT